MYNTKAVNSKITISYKTAENTIELSRDIVCMFEINYVKYIKQEPLKKAQNSKIAKFADSVWLSLFMDGNGKYKLPFTPTNTGWSRIQHLKMVIVKPYYHISANNVIEQTLLFIIVTKPLRQLIFFQELFHKKRQTTNLFCYIQYQKYLCNIFSLWTLMWTLISSVNKVWCIQMLVTYQSILWRQ